MHSALKGLHPILFGTLQRWIRWLCNLNPLDCSNVHVRAFEFGRGSGCNFVPQCMIDLGV
jgi:hypothetical protein